VLDLTAWQRWFDSLDRSFVFLLVLPFVVGAVGLWSDRKHTTEKESRTASKESTSKTKD
jgi:hypothetical protein